MERTPDLVQKSSDEKFLEEKHRELGVFFSWVKNESCEGVPGIIKIESKTGPKEPAVALMAMVHGNEPSGLDVLKFVNELLKGGKNLLKGTVYLIVANLPAAEKYFESDGKDKTIKYRGIKMNMNRLPADLAALDPGENVELARAKALVPLLERCRRAQDFHSTSQPSDPLILCDCKLEDLESVMDQAPIKVRLRDLELMNTPLFHFVGKSGDPFRASFLVESGSHDHPASFIVAKQCALAMLESMGMIAKDLDTGIPEPKPVQREEYAVRQSIIFPNDTFRIVRHFANYEWVSKGTVLAQGYDKDNKYVELKASEDGYIIMCPADLEFNRTDEEAMFLCSKQE